MRISDWSSDVCSSDLRIREEQRRGRSILHTVEVGYKEASRAIFDANITNVIAAALMFYFGSGPIRGFAVVLDIGVIDSGFTAVTVSRTLASFWLRQRPTQLTIQREESGGVS